MRPPRVGGDIFFLSLLFCFISFISFFTGVHNGHQVRQSERSRL